jgi:hypothetical protein
MDSNEYDIDGRLLSAPIMVAVCSPGGGGVDISTMREYGICCPACMSKRFYEAENGHELLCKACHATVGIKAVEEMTH